MAATASNLIDTAENTHPVIVTRTTWDSIDTTRTLYFKPAMGGHVSTFRAAALQRSKATIESLFTLQPRGQCFQRYTADEAAYMAAGQRPPTLADALEETALRAQTLANATGRPVEVQTNAGTAVALPQPRVSRGDSGPVVQAPPSYLVLNGHARGAVGYKTPNRKRGEDPSNATTELRALEETIRLERRASYDVSTHDSRMLADGVLTIETKDGTLRVEPEAPSLTQLFGRVALAADCQSPGHAMSDWCGSHLVRARSSAFNGMALQAAANAAVTGQEGDDNGTTTKVRTRVNADGVRTAFAAVSDRYAVMDADHVARELYEVAKGRNSVGGVSYDGQRTRINITAGDAKPAKDAKVGDAFKFGISVSTDDTGRGGVHVLSYVERLGCTNGMTYRDKASEATTSLRHMGSASNLAKKFAATMEAVRRHADKWLTMFDVASAAKIATRGVASTILYATGRGRQTHETQVRLDNLMGQIAAATPTRGDIDLVNALLVSGTLRALMQDKVLPVAERGADDVVGMLLRAHEDRRNDSIARVNGPSIASVANAVSLYAHDAVSCGASENLGVEAQAAWEAAAGDILSRGSLPWMPVEFTPQVMVQSLRA